MKIPPVVGALLVGSTAAAGVAGSYFAVRQVVSKPPVEAPLTADVRTTSPPAAPASRAADAAPAVRETPPPPPASPAGNLSGTYRCWSFNVGGRGSRCTSPPITLNADGTYAMSSERGRYTLSGNRLVLSESKIRGPGTLSDDRLRITFEYTYNRLAHTVTYLKQETAPVKSSPAAGPVYLDLTIHFAEAYDGIDGVTAVQLVPQGGGTTYEALAYATDDQTLKAYFKPSRGGVPGGSVYQVYLSFVGERVAVGQVDLRTASGEVSRTIQAAVP